VNTKCERTIGNPVRICRRVIIGLCSVNVWAHH